MIDLNDDRIEGLDELEWSLKESWNNWKRRLSRWGHKASNAIKHSRPWRYSPAYWLARSAYNAAKNKRVISKVKKYAPYAFLAANPFLGTTAYLAGKTLKRRHIMPHFYGPYKKSAISASPVQPIQPTLPKEHKEVRSSMSSLLKYAPLLIIPFLL